MDFSRRYQNFTIPEPDTNISKPDISGEQGLTTLNEVNDPVVKPSKVRENDLKEKPLYVSGGWKELEARPFNPRVIVLISFIIIVPVLLFFLKGIFSTSEAAGDNLIGAGTVNLEHKLASTAEISIEPADSSVDYSACVNQLSAALIIDMSTGEELFNYNATNQRSIASITKLVTAYVAYNTYNKSQLLTVITPRYYYGNHLDLSEGEFITVDDLISAILIRSSNDAAYILADNYPGGYDKFIAEMNNFASSLGLTNTNFANPVGLDDPTQYSSAADIVKMLNVILNTEYLRSKVETSTKDISLYTIDGEFIRGINLTNVNELLLDGTVDGGKTGYTGGAGGCLVSYVGNTVYVVLGANDRFESTKCLLGVDSEAVKE